VIREALAAKRKAEKAGRHKRVIVAGCLVQRHKEGLLKEVPEVDALVGVFDRGAIVEAVRGIEATSEGDKETRRQGEGEDLGRYHAVSTFIHKPTRGDIGKGYVESDRARLRLTPRHYAYLRVSEGCNQGCTFCTIPSIRGRMRSKPLADILAEARELLADEVVEINLIGQDTTSYGTDIGYNQKGEGLSGMLRALNRLVEKETPGRWLRLMYAYPSCFTDEMIDALAECGNVVKYIDMPLQHINDGLLQAMRRKVTRKQTEELLEKLRRRVPGIALRTTFISGFPGETEGQHAELVQFVKDFRFDNVGVFEFSPEPGTPAGRQHQERGVPADVATRRKEEIMLAQQEIVFARNAEMVGQTVTVLVDEMVASRRKSAVHAALARHGGQAPDIDGRVILEKCPAGVEPGTLLMAKVTGYRDYDLVAVVTEEAAIPSRKAKGAKRGRVSLPVLASVEARGKGA
jgi:ribosomal protein S12 methylthiotransferase